MKTIICDLDGTLFDINHRLHHLAKKDWDSFFAAVKDDTPNQWCLELLTAMKAAGHEIVFVSGRNESARAATDDQLMKLGFGESIVSMRAEADRRPDYVLKKEYYEANLYGRDVLFVLEDRTQVVRMWRSKGLTVLQCDEGEF